MGLGVLLGGFALQLAIEDIGKGEACDHGGAHRNNCGPYVRLVRGDAKREAWCAAVVSWWFRGAATQLDVRLPFTPSHSARRLFKRMVAAGGTVVKQPQLGDVMLLQRGWNPRIGQWDPFKGHIGIVSRVESGGIQVDPLTVRQELNHVQGDEAHQGNAFDVTLHAKMP